MINKISVENRNLNSRYLTQSDNKDSKNPSFKGAGIIPIILQGVQACERNPMINVAVIDMFSAILPRTFVESLTNWYAGLEALRRESSGLIVNCMIPGFIALGMGHLFNNFIMPKGSNLASCWADSNMLLKLANVYEQSNAEDKVQDSLKKILENVEGHKGKEKLSYKNLLTEAELEEYSKRLNALTKKDVSRKEFKQSIEKITDEIVSKTKIHENIQVNGGKNPVKANTLDGLLSDSVKFFKEYQKVDKKVSINEFAQKGKKLVRTKSLLGLAVVLPLAASMQFINRWITERHSGVKGAPIYHDFGKDERNEEVRQTSREGLLKQKFISISSMIGVGLLSMMKRPTMNMLEFKGQFPSMDQARIISTTTFSSRMAAADDKHELVEATTRDIATFLSLYFLGDYAAKAAATLIEKKKGIKLLNDTKPLEKGANVFKKLWHWFKDVNVKSAKEVMSKTEEDLKSKGLKPNAEQKKRIEKELKKAAGYRHACQVANLGVSLVLLGLVIPIFVRKKTEKKHAEELELAGRDMAETSDETEPNTAQRKAAA